MNQLKFFYIVSMAVVTICLLSACKNKAFEAELPRLNGIPVFEETNWGMSPQQAIKALYLNESDCEIERKEKMIDYSFKNYRWHDAPAELVLTFITQKMPDGKEVGLSVVHLKFDAGKITYEEVLEQLIKSCDLEPQPIQEKETASGVMKSNWWDISWDSLPEDEELKDLLSQEFKKIGAEGISSEVYVTINVTGKAYNDNKGGNQSITIMMASNKAAMINHIAASIQ